MKKLIRLVLTLVIIIPVLVLGAIFVLPQMIDWNAHKQDVADVLSKESGMKITLEGDLELATWPQPKLSVGGIKIASFNGDRDLFSAQNIAIEMDALKLATLGIGVQSFVVEKPQVYLGVDENGVESWLPKRAKKPSGKSSSSSGSSIIKSFGETVISDAQFLYENEQTGERFLVDDVQVSIEGRKPSESQLNASMKVNDVETTLNYNADLSDFNEIKFNGETFFGFSNIKVEGVLENVANFDGTIDVKGSDLLKNIYTVLNLPPEQRTLMTPIYVKTGLKTQDGNLLLKDLQVSANSENAAVLKGEIEYKAPTRRNKMQVNVKLRADETLDLNHAGLCEAEAGESVGGSTSSSKGAPWTSDIIDLTVLETLQAYLDVQTKRIVCGATSIDSVNVLGQVSDGKVNLTRAEIRQGSGSVNTTAMMDVKNKMRTKVDVNIDNLPLEKFLSEERRKTVSANVLGNIKLNFAGQSTLDWVKNLNGSIELGSQDMFLQSFAFDSLLFTAKNFFGQKSDKPHSLSEKKASFAMAYKINQGVMQTESFEVVTGEGTLNGEGKVDLVNWKVNYRLTPGKDVKMGVVIPIKVQGDLDSPIIAPDVTSPQGLATGIGAAVGGPLGAGIGNMLGNTIDQMGNKDKNEDSKNPLGGLFKQLQGR